MEIIVNGKRAVLSVYAIRRNNLRELATQWGGPTSLARKLGHANGSYLAQLIGPNPTRELSEKTSREIEQSLGLPVAWMDHEHVHGGASRIDDAALAECVRSVAAALRDANLRPDPEKYATLVQLAFEHARLTGRLNESHIKRLLTLLT